MNLFPRLLPAAAVPLVAGLCLGTAQARPPVPISHPAPSQRIKFDTKKFIPVSELKPGMRGYALTVFKGTKIEKFGIEILGVMAKYNAGKDYIMFRALDGPPVTRHLNIAHGMSGSPIYIGGRLAGAISMGDQFSKDPIGFATPIEDMLDAWSPDLPSKVDSISATADGGRGGGTAESALGGRARNFQQLDLPVSVSGVSGLSLSRMQTALAPFHFDLMAGGGGGEDAAENPLAKGATLQPGSAVGVSLVQGDMDLTATGTVTYRDGNRLLLFGHPFTNFGPIDAALTTAYVVDIFPSYQDSVKYGSPIKTVGRIFQDRPFSVGGLIGSMPHMIPLTVAVNDESLKHQQTFHMQIINHPLLTGQLVTQLAGAAITQVHGQPGDSVATVTMDADIEQIGHVHRVNSFYDAVSVDQSAVADVDGLMRLLSSNPFYPLQLKSMKLAVTIQNRHDTAEIDHIFLHQGRYAPGDTIHVGVVLKPYKRDMITRDIAVKIPANTPNGVLTLNVKGGGSDSGGGGLSLGGLIFMQPQQPEEPTANIGQLVKQFIDKPSNDQIIARLTLPTNAINVNGEKLTSLPPTLASAMLTTHTSGLSIARDEVKEIQTTPYIVSGSQSLSLIVQRKPVGDVVSGAPNAPQNAPTPLPPPSGDVPPMDPLNDGDDVSNIASFGTPTADRLSVAPVLPSPETFLRDTNATAPTPVPPPTTAMPVNTPPPLPQAAPKPAIKTVGRLASIWRQGTAADFSAGTLQNVSVTSTGDVRLAASLTQLGETGESYLWSLLPDGQGHVFAGTGDHGNIYRIDDAGKPTLFFKTGQLEVTSLARDTQGDLYAGTAPHGIVYKIGSDGTGKAFFTTTEKYVTALAYDDSRSLLYVATGGGTGRVYAVAASGMAPAKAWFTSPEAHLLSLTLDPSGNVYAGSSPNGIVYKITPDGKSQVFSDTPDQSISALTTDSAGNVYVGTMPKGTIYKIAPDGSSKLLSDHATVGISGMTTTKDGTLYACSGNTVYRIGTDETTQSFVTPTDEQFLSVAVDPASGEVYTGTATVGSLYTIRASGDPRGQFVSTVHDAGLPAHWGTISWTADAPEGTHITLQTRSGNVERPDDSWSAWSSSYDTPTGQKILSPPGRYLQYQAILTGNADSVSQGSVPKLRQVTVYYLPRNQAPTVKIISPAEGDALSKSALIRWTGGDPDKDVLTFDLSYSGDGGKTWTPIKKKAAPSTGTPTPTTAPATLAPTGPVTDQEIAAQVAKMQGELAKNPEIPPTVRQQIVSQLPSMARQILMSQRSQTGPANDLKEMSYTWDSTEVPDGTYQIRVIASDKVSNPQGALTATSISAPFIVANTAPTLTAFPALGADKSVTVTGVAKASLAFVKAVQARVDAGDPIAAVADDGLFDSATEGYTLITPPLTSGTHRIEIQTVDQAGNIVTKGLTLKIP
jgi:hypothetical protein